MKNSGQTINFFQAGMIFMLMNGLLSHVIINPMLLDAAGRDAWVAVLAAGALYVPWCILLYLFMRKSEQKQFYPWLVMHTNKIVAWIILIPICIQLYLIGLETVIHTSIFNIRNYLPEQTGIIVTIPLTLVSYFFARSGLRSIAIASGILLPIVIMLGYLVSFANMPYKDFTMMLPVFEYGYGPTMQGMIYAGGGFIEIIMLILIQHRLRSKVKYWQLAILALITIYIMFGPITGSITEFGYKEAADQLESPYEQWRLVKLGNDIEHVDFFAVYQWLAGAMIRISLAQYLLAELIPFRSLKVRHILIILLTLSYTISTFFPIENYTFYQIIYTYYIPISLITGIVISVVCAAIAMYASMKKENAA